MKRYGVWYKKVPTFMEDDGLTRGNLAQTHVFLKEIPCFDLNEVFEMMQGERWSPNGEAKGLIESKGLMHTSMSVGDVIHDMEDDEYYEVENFGFRRLQA